MSDNGNGTATASEVTTSLGEEMAAVIRAKRILGAIAQDKGQSDLMRRFSRQCLRELNNVIAQAVEEIGG